jgi:hypothetical protein
MDFIVTAQMTVGTLAYSISAMWHFAEFCILNDMLSTVMLSIVLLSVDMLSIVMLSVL